MLLENNSLLLAAGVTACISSLTFLVSYYSDRTNGLFALATAILITLAFSIVAFVLFALTEYPVIGAFACTSLIISMAFLWAGAKQFRSGRHNTKNTIVLSAVLVLATTMPYSLGLDGVAFIITNAASAVLLLLTAREYWACRAENPRIISLVVSLYALIAASFVICAIVLAIETPFFLAGPPGNWAESLNLAISIPAIAGIASLSITLNNHRLIRRHLEDAQTDPLTGAMNRRALFDRFGETGLPPGTAVIVFDLDHFKSVNDTHGHAVGDRFLKIFVKTCRQNSRHSDMIVRLGGEEFVAVLLNSTASTALVVAEIIRIDFAKQTTRARGKTISCTVSAGIHINAANDPQQLDTALQDADRALYRAKHNGRNVVHMQEAAA